MICASKEASSKVRLEIPRKQRMRSTQNDMRKQINYIVTLKVLALNKSHIIPVGYINDPCKYFRICGVNLQAETYSATIAILRKN